MRKCHYCGREVIPFRCTKKTPLPPSNGLTRDHLEPVRIRGKNLSKVVDCCFVCNQMKGCLSLEEFRLVKMFQNNLIPKGDWKFPGEQQ